MPYDPQTWVDDSVGGTPISAARLNYMEDGIDDAHTTADAAASSVASGQAAVVTAQSTADGALAAATAAQGTANANAAKSILTTKGDLLVATGPSTLARLGVGSDGRHLESDLSAATGVKWGRRWVVADTAPGGAQEGDIWIKPSLVGPRFTVVDGRVYDPEGVEFTGAGMNVSVNILGTASWAPNAATLWSHNGHPAGGPSPIFHIDHDVWPGIDNSEATGPEAGIQQMPGGGINACAAWSQAKLGIFDIPDRVYAMTGFRSSEAIALGIAAPADHWHTRYARITCFVRPGPETWGAADGGLSVQNLIDQYIAAANELAGKGLIVSPEHHAFTGLNPVMPANFVLNPTLPANQTPADDDIRDTLRFLDAVVDNCDPASVLLELPNESHNTRRTQTYDDWVVTLVRRARARGWIGAIIVPLGGWAGDLAGLAAGHYETLVDRLESYGVGWGIIWSWHNYGAHWPSNLSSIVDYNYADTLSHVMACRNGVAGTGRQHAVLLGEYGQPTPFGSDPAMTGFLETRARTAVEIMAGTGLGTPIGTLAPWLVPSWWHACGDSYFVRRFSLTTGPGNQGNDNGDDPYGSVQDPPGSYPFWDISGGSTLVWLSVGGLKHWNLSHAIAAL